MFRNIVVGISGGVDSAVATLLLKRKGFNVTAVFLKNWDTADETGKCLADEDFKDAQWVCKKLDVPLLQVDFVKEYWHEVFTYLVDSYERGQTPNPDIICNKNIKFNKFYEYARNNLSADAIATGHYAKSSFGSYLENYRPDSKVKLLNAEDTIKDQTFFLSQVRQVPLQRCMFPLGDYKKTDVKKIAVENGLDIIAKKAESMGICFIGNRTFQNFISEYIEDKPGNFVDYDTGKVVGKHKGFHLWTLGQKCGIAGAPKPYFIYRKDSNSNDILVVQGTDHPALFTRLIVTSKPYWIHEEPRELSNSGVLECDFKFQRSHPAVPCKVFKTPSNRLIIQLAKAKRAISPGQFAVFYLNNECLGSAPIAQPGPSLQAIGETIDSDLDEFLDIGYRATI